jgi:apolipoprotein N-acyltransferase
MKTKTWPFWTLAAVAFVAVVLIIALNAGRTQDRLASAATQNMMRVGMLQPDVPKQVERAPADFETKIVKAEPPAPVEPVPGEKSKPKGECDVWPFCAAGFPDLNRFAHPE